MSRILVGFGLAVCLGLPGCGPKASPPAKEKVAAETKTLVHQFVTKAKSQAPKAAAADLAVLLENLEARAKDQGGGYQKLLDAAKELQKTLQGSAARPQINQQLDELSQAASSL
jgi:hypothetical protein